MRGRRVAERRPRTYRKCLTHDLWANLNTHIFNYLRSVTLAELVRNHQARGGVSVIQVTERRPGASTVPA